MLMRQTFQVGPRAAPQTISSGSQDREENRRYAKEPDIERPDPEIEQIAADKGAAARAIFWFKTEHRHCQNLPSNFSRQLLTD